MTNENNKNELVEAFEDIQYGALKFISSMERFKEAVAKRLVSPQEAQQYVDSCQKLYLEAGAVYVHTQAGQAQWLSEIAQVLGSYEFCATFARETLGLHQVHREIKQEELSEPIAEFMAMVEESGFKA